MSLKPIVLKHMWSRLWQSRADIVMVVSLILGMVLLVWGYSARPASGIISKPGSLAWVAGLSFEIARILLAGGFLAFFLRLFQIMEVMEKALEKFIVSDGFMKIATQYDDVWADITARLYLKGSETVQGEFTSNIKSVIKNTLFYRKNYYVSDMKLHFDVSMDTETPGNIVIEETNEYKAIPIWGESIVITTRFKPKEGVSLDKYTVLKDELTVQNIPIIPGRPRKAKDETKTTEYTISGQKEYCIVRKWVLTWPLEADKVFKVTTNSICNGLEFTCDCVNNDLKTTFVSFGEWDRFTNRMSQQSATARIGDQWWKCDGILLPHNGFAILFEKV